MMTPFCECYPSSYGSARPSLIPHLTITSHVQHTFPAAPSPNALVSGEKSRKAQDPRKTMGAPFPRAPPFGTPARPSLQRRHIDDFGNRLDPNSYLLWMAH